MTKVYLCIITMGDAEFDKLKLAVSSVADYVDGVYITTNAKKHSKVKQWCKTNGYHHSHLPWNDDFSAQRNFNFSQVPDDTDYVLWMDSDDYVVGAKHLPVIADNAKRRELDVVFFDYWYGNEFDGEPSPQTFVKKEVVQKRERLINPRKMQWKSRLHETPVPHEGVKYDFTYVNYDKDYQIAWMHLEKSHGMDEDRVVRRMDRNRRLLELQLKDEREVGEADPRTLLYLMKIYAEMDDEPTLRQCILMGQEYLNKSGWDAERTIASTLMAKCMGKLGDHKGAKQQLLTALSFPYDPLVYLYLAKTCFNLDDFDGMKHWLDIALSIDTTDSRVAMQNLLELKSLSAELLLRYYMNGKKDVEKAYEAAKLLNKVLPNETHQENVDALYDQVQLNEAAKSLHDLILYYEDIDRTDLIVPAIESSLETIQKLPFAIHFYNKYRKPRTWGKDEICYYATFGGDHFEKWDGNSLKTGIGGSETAVIRLSEEWAKLGYKVTVYCDPREETVINGVTYKPHYMFNHRDKFNIFISWRHANLAGKINAKKFYVDLHDLYNQENYLGKEENVDSFMVKTKYHRDLAPDMSKFNIISNGIY